MSFNFLKFFLINIAHPIDKYIALICIKSSFFITFNLIIILRYISTSQKKGTKILQKLTYFNLNLPLKKNCVPIWLCGRPCLKGVQWRTEVSLWFYWTFIRQIKRVSIKRLIYWEISTGLIFLIRYHLAKEEGIFVSNTTRTLLTQVFWNTFISLSIKTEF